MQVPAGAAQCSLLAFLEASATFAVIFTSIQSIGQQRVLASAVKHIGGGGGGRAAGTWVCVVLVGTAAPPAPPVKDDPIFPGRAEFEMLIDLGWWWVLVARGKFAGEVAVG